LSIGGLIENQDLTHLMTMCGELEELDNDHVWREEEKLDLLT
jgi:hypothetical protein